MEIGEGLMDIGGGADGDTYCKVTHMVRCSFGVFNNLLKFQSYL